MALADVDRVWAEYAAAWSSHDMQRVLSFFTDDCVYEDVALGELHRGKAALKAFGEGTFTQFPDFRIEMTSGFVAGNRGAGEWVLSGTAKVDQPGAPGTSKPYSIRGASVWELQAGKVKRCADYWDQVALRQQLGTMPPD